MHCFDYTFIIYRKEFTNKKCITHLKKNVRVCVHMCGRMKWFYIQNKKRGERA